MDHQHYYYRHYLLARFRRMNYLPHYNGSNAQELEALETLMLQEFTHCHEPNADALTAFHFRMKSA